MRLFKALASNVSRVAGRSDVSPLRLANVLKSNVSSINGGPPPIKIVTKLFKLFASNVSMVAGRSDVSPLRFANVLKSNVSQQIHTKP